MTHGDEAHGGAGAAAEGGDGRTAVGSAAAADGTSTGRAHDTAGRRTLAGRTLLMSGGSRGIGLAIALRAARDGANVAIMAKTDQPHPKLEGTVHTAAAQIEAAGGRALPIIGDVRFEESVAEAVERTAAAFGGIDVVVNNASAIDLSPTDQLPMKKYDLMQDINARGSFLLAKTALPHLRKAADGAHVLTLSPPLNLNPHWAGKHLGYTMSKYGMSLVTLGLAEELRDERIAANSLWPRTTIATAAVQNALGGDALTARSRTPEIMADAAWAILTRDPAACTGRFLIDEDVLREEGVTDFSGYLPGGGADGAGGAGGAGGAEDSVREEDLELDIFLDG
ncbi:NAD(P)-dependent oxidoreductase [Brevibacterium salitolerans]|uniref:NAD(P)-dependent oxidoreductase n=1 Tax=Brevibacterium salitolerans TaxID=1403566 RepID=A0ABN2WTG3_9MICO